MECLEIELPGDAPGSKREFSGSCTWLPAIYPAKNVWEWMCLSVRRLVRRGDTSQNQDISSENEKEDGRGRPTIPDNFLVGSRNAWVWLLQESWPEIGWAMLSIRRRTQGSINDIRAALAPLQEKSNGSLARSLLHETKPVLVSSEQIRRLRHSLFELGKSIQEKSAEVNEATWKCNEVIAAFAQPVSLTSKDQETIEGECIERYTRLIRAQKKLRNLEERANAETTQLRDQEAAFYQAELLNYLISKRCAVEPLSIANALAGLPTMRWRQSYDRCSEMQYEAEPHPSYSLLCSVNEIWRKRPDELVSDPIEFFKQAVLKLPKHSSARTYLMKNWSDFRGALKSSWNPDNYFGDELPFVITRTFLRFVDRLKSPKERIMAVKGELHE
jgi:hypothetical protein